MANFEEIFADLKKESKHLINATLKKFKQEAEKDINDFLDNSKEKLKRWTKLLASGELTEDDFEFLVESQKDLLVLNALKSAGLSKIRLDQVKNSILNLVIDTVIDKIL